MSQTQLTGAVLDLDGVITETVQVHFAAWKATFDELIEELHGPSFVAFTHDADYVPYVDGKPRFDGVADFLAAREISLPYGSVDDPPTTRTVCGVGNRKNQRFRELVEQGGVQVYQTTLALVDAFRARGNPVAVASSSRNCSFVLETTGLIDRFQAVVDGNTSRELGLKGKPAPDIFVTAAERVGIDPAASLVVEDAYAGVAAGRAGGFGVVLGVARNGDRQGLRDRGADLVVEDLGETTLEDLDAFYARAAPV